MDEEPFTVLGGEAEAINTRLEEAWEDTLRPGRGHAGRGGGPGRARPHPGPPSELEAAVLERTDARRAFRRLELDERTALLG